MHHPTLLCIAVVLAVLVSHGAGAQVGAAGALDMRLARFGDLHPGDHARIEIRGSNRIVGQVLGSRSDSLVFNAAGRVTAVGLHDIGALWVRGPATWRGAKIGAFWGAALTAAFFAAGTAISVAASDCDAREPGLEVIGMGFIGGILGGTGGGLVGAAIGSRYREWHLRYADPTPLAGDHGLR